MSESDGHAHGREDKAVRLLALHAQHREGLHATPIPECIQCTFDGFGSPESQATTPLVDPEPS
jgi:hypothetical protein